MKENEAKVFKFRDIFKAWAHSWRFHRLLISGFALIISVIIGILLYRPPILRLSTLSCPFISGEFIFSFNNILAVILIGVVFFIAKMCISYSIRREAVDDEIFVGWKDIGKFLRKNLKTLLFFILGWILVFVLIALGQLFFYVIGAIPYVGSLWLSIMYLIPLAIAIFFVLTLVVLLFADSYGAVIIGVEQKSAMDTIIDLYHLVKDHAIYIIVCGFLSLIVGMIAYIFVLGIMQGAVAFTSWGAELIMGKEFTKITLPPFFQFLNSLFPGLNLPAYAGAGGYYFVPGFIIGIFLILVGSVGFSYIFTYMTGAETFIYLSTQEKFYPKKEEIEEEAPEEKEEKEETEEEAGKEEEKDTETEEEKKE
jgi:signal transduction histidine kinase